MTDFGHPFFLFSATTRFCVVALKFATHIHVPVRMNCQHFDPFRVLLAPPSGQNETQRVYCINISPKPRSFDNLNKSDLGA